MKTGIVYVAREKFEELLTKHGFTVTPQSGFLRVDGPKGNRIYVAKTNRVGRVDISGFEVDPTIGKTPHMGVQGQVKQQLRMDGTEDEVLARFERLLEELKKQAAKVPAPKVAKPKAPTTDGDGGTTTGTVEAAPTQTPEEEASAKRQARLARIAEIKKVSASMNQNISKKLLAEEAELLAQEQAAQQPVVQVETETVVEA